MGLNPYILIISELNPSIPNSFAHFLICSAAVYNNPFVDHYASKALDKFGILIYYIKEGRAELVKYYYTRD